jgi:CheY-like chemotaxis protein
MSKASLNRNGKHRILIADDEPDIHLISKMSLKNLRYQGRRVEFISAHSGREVLEIMKSEGDIAVILLDVVMETDHAGLDACRAIREELGNPFVRILLRTGQPGAAPEKQVIQDYDIDGYLPKAELTSVRLFTNVRTSLKAYNELVELERHRRNLAAIHDCVVSLRSYEPVETALERMLHTVCEICPSELAVLHLETFEEEGNPQQYFLFRSTFDDPVEAEVAAEQTRLRVAANPDALGLRVAASFEEGFLVPLNIDHELGHGWIYLSTGDPDQLARHGLPLLAAHGVNVLYSAVTQSILSNQQEGDIFDQMQI